MSFTSTEIYALLKLLQDSNGRTFTKNDSYIIPLRDWMFANQYLRKEGDRYFVDKKGYDFLSLSNQERARSIAPPRNSIIRAKAIIFIILKYTLLFLFYLAIAVLGSVIYKRIS
jgi:hypothetical protein